MTTTRPTLFFIWFVLLLCLPGTAYAGENGPGSELSTTENISLVIYSPGDRETLCSDVSGMPVTVLGEVTAVNGIQNVTITDNTFFVTCQDPDQTVPTEFNIRCEVPRNYNTSEAYMTRYVIRVYDTQGNGKILSRDFIIRTGIPPPEWFSEHMCSVHGNVTDPEGEPVTGATLLFEFPGLRVWDIAARDFRSFQKIVNTTENGTYATDFAGRCSRDIPQNITVTKPGYATITRELHMDANVNEVNIVLTTLAGPPPGKTPGFTLWTGLLALLAVSIAISDKRER